jgi:hypothetical protein
MIILSDKGGFIMYLYKDNLYIFSKMSNIKYIINIMYDS